MQEPQTHTIVDMPPQSSVQIEGRSKGPPIVTVKVYAPTAFAAAELAVRVYRHTVAQIETGSDDEEEVFESLADEA